MGQFRQGEKTNQLQALNLLGNMSGQKMQDPIIQQKQGYLGPLIGAGGQAAGAWLGA